MANDGGMRRAVERSALGSVGVHFWGFFVSFLGACSRIPLHLSVMFLNS